MTTTPLNKTPLFVSAVMLFVASADVALPYGYFQMLRLVVCGTAVYAALKAREAHRQNWTWVMAAVAALFNPIVLMRFSRAEWQPIDFIVGIVFVIAAWSMSRRPISAPPNRIEGN